MQLRLGTLAVIVTARNEARLTAPLKRVGNRGSGQWEEVSWDEALSALADSLGGTMITYVIRYYYLGYGTEFYLQNTDGVDVAVCRCY